MGDDRSFITAFCRQCQAPRYRSVKPLSRKDEARPELFKALDPDAPEPAEGAANCYLCHDRLVFLADNKLPPVVTVAPVRNAAVTEPTEAEYAKLRSQMVLPPPLQVETLFELRPSEELKSFHESPLDYTFVTTQRIVRVTKPRG